MNERNQQTLPVDVVVTLDLTSRVTSQPKTCVCVCTAPRVSANRDSHETKSQDSVDVNNYNNNNNNVLLSSCCCVTSYFDVTNNNKPTGFDVTLTSQNQGVNHVTP